MTFSFFGNKAELKKFMEMVDNFYKIEETKSPLEEKTKITGISYRKGWTSFTQQLG